MEYSNTFPLPPSVNHVWKQGKGRTYKAPEYAKWERLADQYGLLKPRSQLTGDVVAVYACGKPSKRRMDVANREKGISDTLQRWGIIQDDSQITDIRLYWADDVEPGMVRVTLQSK